MDSYWTYWLVVSFLSTGRTSFILSILLYLLIALLGRVGTQSFLIAQSILNKYKTSLNHYSSLLCLGFALSLAYLLKNEMATHSNILAWEIPMDRGAWWATVHGITELDMTEQLSITITVMFIITMRSINCWVNSRSQTRLHLGRKKLYTR